MPFVPAAQTAEFAVDMLLRGEAITNIIHLRMSPMASWTSSLLTSAAAVIGVNWGATVMPHVGGNCELIGVRGRDLAVEGGAAGSWAPVFPIAGSMSGETLPNNVAICYTKRTERTGRSYRGRLYLGGLVESQVNGNFLATGVPALIGDIFNDLIETFSSEALVWVLVSKFHNGAPRVTADVTEVTSVVLRDFRVDSMRSRLP